MNFSKIKNSLILIVGLFLTTQVNAQLCGKYSTTLNILSENDKKVENVFVQLAPLSKDETRGKTFKQSEEDTSKFVITFQEGHQLYNKYKAIISVQQFETYEMELEFPHCKNQDFVVKLKPINEKSAIVLGGIVTDVNGGIIEDVQITASDNENGNYYRTSTNKTGSYNLNISVGKYKIEFVENGFLTTIIKDFYAKEKAKYRFDVILDVDLECPTCIYSEFVCKPSEKNKGDFGCIYLNRKGKGNSKP